MAGPRADAGPAKRDAMTPVIELREVTVERDGRLVLEVPHFSVGPQEIVGVVGPNGAGKSTLLQAMALLLPVASGEIRLIGRRIDPRRDPVPIRRRIGLLFQEPLLFDMTVFDNVAIGLRLRGLRGRELARRVEPWLERLGLSGLRDRPARALSGGEAHRASLARAVVLEPELLLLDEPFRSLDFRTHQSLVGALPELLAETCSAAVLVTHDPWDLARVADRAVALENGTIQAEGTPESVVRWMGAATGLPTWPSLTRVGGW